MQSKKNYYCNYHTINNNNNNNNDHGTFTSTIDNFCVLMKDMPQIGSRLSNATGASASIPVSCGIGGLAVNSCPESPCSNALGSVKYGQSHYPCISSPVGDFYRCKSTNPSNARGGYDMKRLQHNQNVGDGLAPHLHKKSTANNNVDRRQRGGDREQEYMAGRKQKHQSFDGVSSHHSTNQHYQHYYSYYYDHLPKMEFERSGEFTASSGGRKLPSTAAAGGGVASAMKRQNSLDNRITKADLLTFHRSMSIDEQHNVLKERLTNNNIIDQWLTHISESDQLEDPDHYVNTIDAKHHMQSCGKRKPRTISGPEAIDCLSDESPPFSPPGSPDKKTDKHNGEHQTTKIDASKGKGYAHGKKPPISHRVLLYNRQSPHLPRSTASTRLHEMRRGRGGTIASGVTNGDAGPSKSSTKVVEMKRTDQKSDDTTERRPFHIEHSRPLPDTNARILQRLRLDIERKLGGKDIAEIDVARKILNHDNVTVKSSDEEDDSDDNFDDDDLDNVSQLGEDNYAESSESEDGYRAFAYKMTHSTSDFSGQSSVLQDSSESLSNPEALLVPSLFPNVPPYLAFSSNTVKGPPVPHELFRVLKWRVNRMMPRVVRNILDNSGMRMLKKSDDWMGVWGKHMKSPGFKRIRPYQKINHFPGSFRIGRKDSCWRNLTRQSNKHSKRDFGFMPKTYIMPGDLNLLRMHWPKYAQRNVKWIIKPPASARGTGIRVVNRWSQIPKRKPLIVQRYIERPLLINGSKFDLRLYVLVTSLNPLRVYMYKDGLARFASVKYSGKADTLSDRCMHLTNYSINKFSTNYAKNEDVNACHGHKWTIRSLWNYLSMRNIRTDLLWEALRSLVLRTILAGESPINNMIRSNVECKYSCFELFGFDVLLDADLVPWLLEVNISPSLHSDLPLDAHVKAPLVQAVLNTALYNVPPKILPEHQREISLQMNLPSPQICFDKRMYINYLSGAEKLKHNRFTRRSLDDRNQYLRDILEHLTPDDVRCLVVAEDELARSLPLERIFPTQNSHKLLKFTESPRYYNRLLDAWEHRYGNNRSEGHALLREYCERSYHLEVPPPRAKKVSNAENGEISHRSDVSQDTIKLEEARL